MSPEREMVRALLPAFQSQGLDVVYAVRCCGRLFVGKAPAKQCRTCPNLPACQPVKTDGTDLDNLSL